MASHEHLTAAPVTLAITVARAVLAGVTGLALVALAPSVLAGWWSGVVVSGSMSPAVGVGDVVITRPVPGTPVPGRIVAVRDPDDPDLVLVHRLSGFTADGRLVTKGDANAEPDSTPVVRSALLGVGVLRVPYVGRPVVWARARDLGPLALCAAACALTALVASVRIGGDRALRGEGRHAHHPHGGRRKLGPAGDVPEDGAVPAVPAVLDGRGPRSAGRHAAWT